MESLNLQQYENVIVAALATEVTIANAQLLRDKLESALRRTGVTDLVLDLGNVPYMDSSGLGCLITVSTRARGIGKRLLLYRPSREVRNLLDAAQLMGLFPMLSSEEDLLALLPD